MSTGRRGAELRTGPVRRRATYEDLLARSKASIVEIVDGTLYTSPRPSIAQGVSAFALGGVLGDAYQLQHAGPGGWWLLFQPELQLGDDVLVADLAGWRRERLSRPPDTVAIDLAPDWVCEVLSSETESLDRVHKVPAYARHGVPHAWLVSPAERSLEVLRREGARWRLFDTFRNDARVRIEPFAAAELALPWLWAETSPP